MQTDRDRMNLMNNNDECIVRQLMFGGAMDTTRSEDTVDPSSPALIPVQPSSTGNNTEHERLTTSRDSSSLPTKLDDLDRQQTNVYVLSLSAALNLSIPIIGSISGGQNRKVVVLETKRWKEVELSDSTAQFGYAIRLAITTNKQDSSMKLSLAYLAAEAQIGLIEAGWTLYCIGLSGKPIDDATIPPKELNVETFILAQQSLEAILRSARNSETTFSAVKIEETKKKDQLRREYYKSIARAYALGRIERGRTLSQAMDDLGSGKPYFADFIPEFYLAFVGVDGPGDAIPAEARQRARAFLQTVDVVTRA